MFRLQLNSKIFSYLKRNFLGKCASESISELKYMQTFVEGLMCALTWYLRLCLSVRARGVVAIQNRTTFCSQVRT